MCKAYTAVGQAGGCLYTMAVLQAYQADLLKEMDKGEEIKNDDITELRRATDLSLRATKEIVRAIGWSMAALVATERHLWLTLSQINDKDRVFLLDAPISPSGLFGDAVNTVVDRFQEAKKQAEKLRCFSDFSLAALMGLIGGIIPSRVLAPHIEKSRNGALLLTPLHRKKGRRGAALQVEVFEGNDWSEDRCFQ